MVRDQSAVSAFSNFKASDAPAATGAKPPAPAAAAPTPAPTQAPSQPVAQPPPPPPKPTPAPAPQSTPVVSATGGRVFATPLARKLAAERNIDLSVFFILLYQILIKNSKSLIISWFKVQDQTTK